MTEDDGDDDESTAKRPVLVRRILRRDGTENVGFSVYCTEDGHALDLDACRACAVCDGVFAADDGAAEVRCRPRSTPPEAPGGLMRGAITCVEEDVTSAQITPLFLERGVETVLVVDADGHLMGTIRSGDLARAASAPHIPGLDPELALVALRETSARFAELRADALMSTAVRIDDGDDLERAVRKLARAHARELVIISRDGEPVGVVRDVDIVRAVARLRQKSSNFSG
jgi:CBS-domain-containing membrane protein